MGLGGVLAVPGVGLGVGDLGVGVVAARAVDVVLGGEEEVEVRAGGLGGGAAGLGPGVLGVDPLLERARGRVATLFERDAEVGVDAADGARGPLLVGVEGVAGGAVAERQRGRVVLPEGLAEGGAVEARVERGGRHRRLGVSERREREGGEEDERADHRRGRPRMRPARRRASASFLG